LGVLCFRQPSSLSKAGPNTKYQTLNTGYVYLIKNGIKSGDLKPVTINQEVYLLTTFKTYRKFFSACDLFSQWRIKYVFASERGHKAKKGRLFSFGFLGFSRPVRNVQAAFFFWD